MKEFGVQRWLCRAMAALLVAGAWAAIGYGLILSPPDHLAWGELEAGGRFAVNFAVYLPFYFLTLPVTVVVLFGLSRSTTALSPLTVTAFCVALFAIWVGAQDLFGPQPRLFLSLVGCLVADAYALAALAGAWAFTRRP